MQEQGKPLEDGTTGGTPCPLAACTGGLGLGGSTTFLLNLGRDFKQRGLDLEILCMNPQNDMAADFAAASIQVRHSAGPEKIYEDRIREAYLKIAPRRPAAVLACLSSESFEVLRVVPEHTVKLALIQSDDPGVYEMARYFAPWIEAIVGVSERICTRLRQDTAYARTRIEYIPYGIYFAPELARSPREAGEPLKVIYLGRMIEEQKRVSRLVELVQRLVASGLQFEFRFIGSGPALVPIQTALKGISQAIFLDALPNEQARALLQSQDIYVLLSDYEGLPLSLLEAMGAGVVPVTSDLESGLRDVVTEDAGIRIPVGQTAAAAEAIIGLANDPDRLAAFSRASSSLARSKFTAAQMGQSYLKLIGALARPGGEWPARPIISPPLMVQPTWLYQGLPRVARRILKRLSRGR